MDARKNDTPRLLTEDEIKNADIDRLAWVEVKNSNFIFVVLLSWIPEKYFNCGYYRRRWRLWAEEPSEELRERTEWDDLGGAETET